MNFRIHNFTANIPHSYHNNNKLAVISDFQPFSTEQHVDIEENLISNHRDIYCESPISLHAARKFSHEVSNKVGRKCLSFTFDVSYIDKNQNANDTWMFTKDPIPWGTSKGVSIPSEDNTVRIMCIRRKRFKV
jgi:hypothetical protein